MYFSATDWRTIDGGLGRLPNAFHRMYTDFYYWNPERLIHARSHSSCG